MINTIVNYVNFYYYKYKKNLDFSENTIKTALIYRYLYENTFKKNIPLENIIYILNFIPNKTNSRVLNNHLIFYKAFKSFYDRYKIGRGCVYVFEKISSLYFHAIKRYKDLVKMETTELLSKIETKIKDETLDIKIIFNFLDQMDMELKIDIQCDFESNEDLFS